MKPEDPSEAAVLEAVRRLYYGAAEHYERDRARWLHVAGGPAEAAMREDLAAVLRPGARVLDLQVLRRRQGRRHLLAGD